MNMLIQKKKYFTDVRFMNKRKHEENNDYFVGP